MADDKHEPPGLPGSVVIEAYGAEIRKAIVDGVKAATEDSRRRSVRWYVATVVVSAAIAAVVAWLIASPSSPKEWVIVHADGLRETCEVSTDPSGQRVAFTCHLTPEPVPPPPASPIVTYRPAAATPAEPAMCLGGR